MWFLSLHLKEFLLLGGGAAALHDLLVKSELYFQRLNIWIVDSPCLVRHANSSLMQKYWCIHTCLPVQCFVAHTQWVHSLSTLQHGAGGVLVSCPPLLPLLHPEAPAASTVTDLSRVCCTGLMQQNTQCGEPPALYPPQILMY